MTFHTRGLALAVTLGALATVAPACAQENLDQGKGGAQLFASNCVFCHKSPQGLASKSGGVFGLDGFLREHYTASRETAAILAKYLQSVGGEAPAADSKRGGSRSAAKPSAKKPDDAKAGGKSESKPEPKSESKADAKPETKSEATSEPKPEPKPDAKPETKPEAKPDADKPKSE